MRYFFIQLDTFSDKLKVGTNHLFYVFALKSIELHLSVLNRFLFVLNIF